MKSTNAKRVSVRLKLKGNHLEVVIIDADTNEVQYEQIPIKIGSEFPVPETKDEDEQVQDASEGTDEVGGSE